MRGLNNNKGVEPDVEVEEKTSKWRVRLSNIQRKLKLGQHYKMERFTILLGASITMLLLFTTLSFVNHRSDVANLASSQALFTEDFKFSLSNQRMHVEGVYGDKDRTDVMVLLRMVDAEGMSTDAKNYELFITGERDSLKYEPDVSLSFFGSTGYGIIRFQMKDGEPLPKQIMDITIRANTDLSGRQGSGTSGEKDSKDGSFANYDQGKLYVNPGAENVTVLENYKVGEEDPSKLYISLVADAKDKEIKEEIETTTSELGKLLNRTKEYANRLSTAGYTPPEEPWFIKGDYIDDDGVLRPAQDVMRAHVFDYHTQTIHEGYIRQVMRDFADFDKYMKNRAVVEGDASIREEIRREQFARTESLQHEDGSALTLNMVSTGSSPSAHVSAKDSVEALETTWRTYVKTKVKLQRDLMRDLLVLDADVLSQPSSYSENRDKDAVTFY